MQSFIVFSLFISTTVTFILGHYGASIVSIISAVVLIDVFRHFRKELPDEHWDALDEINTQDADLNSED